jgi:glycosyltransferase involved in cell wall biosynthesis
VDESPIRVLHLIDTLGRGGAETLLVTLLPALVREGIQPAVAVLSEPLDLRVELEERGVRVIQVPAFHKWNLIRGGREIERICRDADIALLHAHLYFPSLYAGLVGWGGKVPMVETFHNLAYAGANRETLRLAFRRRLRSAILRRGASAFFGVSEAVAQHYGAALGIGPVEVIPNTIDLDAIEGRRGGGRPSNEMVRLVVPGRLVSEKGHADVLEALTMCKMPPYELVFLGGGPLAESLGGMASGLGISLRVTGSVAHGEFLAELAAADIAIVPSRYEGFGITAAEAMALGVPLLVSDAGGLPEVVGEHGVVFGAGNADMLAAKLTAMISEFDRRMLIAADGARQARLRFDPRMAARCLAERYRRVVHES